MNHKNYLLLTFLFINVLASAYAKKNDPLSKKGQKEVRASKKKKKTITVTTFADLTLLALWPTNAKDIVMKLQQFLVNQTLLDRSYITGTFDSFTQVAVQAFQRNYNLTAPTGKKLSTDGIFSGPTVVAVNTIIDPLFKPTLIVDPIFIPNTTSIIDPLFHKGAEQRIVDDLIDSIVAQND